MNLESPIIIETVNEGSTDWGVSFGGSNPPPEMYVQVASREDAERLCKLLGLDYCGMCGAPTFVNDDGHYECSQCHATGPPSQSE